MHEKSHSYGTPTERFDCPGAQSISETDYDVKIIIESYASKKWGQACHIAIDSYFDYRYGELPYRSLEFKHETHDVEWFQEAPVVNYPNNQAYTRVTEFKYLTGQSHRKTSIVFEFPQAEGDPYYPIPRPENAQIYAKYKTLADARSDVSFVGRLATYKYYNMDQIVAQALTVYGKIAGLKRKDAASLVTLPSRNTSKSLIYPMSIGGKANGTTGNGTSTRVSSLDSVS